MLLCFVVLLEFLVVATSGYYLGCTFQPCEQICVNNRGTLLGYECQCRIGYMVNPFETDKCVFLIKPVCGRGFQNSAYIPYNCVDINECAVNPPCQQLCSNSQGSYKCYCKSGYQINERDHSKCDILKPACDRGFQNSANIPYNCVDINECAVNKPCQHYCFNSQGSFECYCKSAYQINETDPSKCDIINNCQSGYTPNIFDPTQCLDVNECRDSPCEHTCTNTKGSFRCSCRDGFAVDPNNKNKCTDVNECSDSPCEHTCTNTQGSFRCSCRDGFAVDPNNKNKCTGVDACSTGRRCENICTIISTGRKCSCKAGYVINEEDNTLCEEVEVCKTKADVILVFDASASIGAEHFDKQFIFAKRLTGNFRIGPTDVRFGGIVYSRFPEKLFDLRDHSTVETLYTALSNVTFMASSTYTHEAFLLIDKQQLFSVDKGGRLDAPDIVVLFTDGNPTYQNNALESAQRLKDSGVLILGVAIGPDLDLSVLKRITSSPSDALEASSYDTLEYIEKRLTQLLCQVSKYSQRIA